MESGAPAQKAGALIYRLDRFELKPDSIRLRNSGRNKSTTVISCLLFSGFYAKLSPLFQTRGWLVGSQQAQSGFAEQ